MRRIFGKTGILCDGVILGMVTEKTKIKLSPNLKVKHKPTGEGTALRRA